MNILARTIIRCEKNDELDLYEEAVILAKEIGWDNVIQEAYRILCSQRVQSLWYGAACIIYYAAADKIEVPVHSNELIARLYWCLEQYENLGNGENGFNIVWSIVVLIKAFHIRPLGNL